MMHESAFVGNLGSFASQSQCKVFSFSAKQNPHRAKSHFSRMRSMANVKLDLAFFTIVMEHHNEIYIKAHDLSVSLQSARPSEMF
jgi:hypothetical protein